MEKIQEKDVIHERKKVDIQTTILNIINHRKIPSSVKETELRARVSSDPNFVIEAAQFVRADIAYID